MICEVQLLDSGVLRARVPRIGNTPLTGLLLSGDLVSNAGGLPWSPGGVPRPNLLFHARQLCVVMSTTGKGAGVVAHPLVIILAGKRWLHTLLLSTGSGVGMFDTRAPLRLLEYCALAVLHSRAVPR